jgi:hypothetical protein
VFGEDDHFFSRFVAMIPTLTPEAKAILQDARKKAVEAVKKDDDATCNKVITEAMTRRSENVSLRS